MTIKSGFFNSLNHDRVYDADDINSIFDGIITDGVFGNIGSKFTVTPGSGMSVNVGTGKARFHQIFIENDANLVLQISQSDVLLNRIDVVAIRVDKTVDGRLGNIVIVKGSPSQNPVAPVLSNDNQIWEMPIAYINIKANTNAINSSDIQYLVGRNSTPLITAPMQKINLESYISYLEKQFVEWFSSIKGNLSTDAAGNLQDQINTLKTNVDAANNALTFSGKNTTAKGQFDVAGKLNAKNGLAIGGNDTFIVKRFGGSGSRSTFNATVNDREDVRINITTPPGYKLVALLQPYTDYRSTVSLYNFTNNIAYCTVYNPNGWPNVPIGVSVDILFVKSV